MPGVAARARGLVLAYERHVALAASDFDIPEARTTAVIGANGSGKSTLLGALAGLVRPRAGTLEVLGRPPARAHDLVSYVLQATRVNEVMPVTVREVVTMGRYAVRGPLARLNRGDRQAVETALERLDIAGLAGMHIGELSGGQRQRVFVAQGLAQQAEMLLLDEPITGLDLVSRDRINAAIEDEVDAGHTVVLTTHDLADAAAADHVLLLAGRVAAAGSPAEVLDPDRLSAAYGVGILHLEDGSIVLDDPHHRRARHVHFERRRGNSR